MNVENVGCGVVSVISAAMLLGGAWFGVKAGNDWLYGYNSRQCARFGAASNYETKMVRYHAVSWECFAKTTDDKWLPKDRLRDLEEGQ